MLLTFDSDKVKAMLDASEAEGAVRRGNMEQNYAVENLREDLTPERRAEIEADAEDGFSFIIQPETEIDTAKIGPGVWLVGDRGVYIMPNVVGQEGVRFDVAYADQVNPEKLAFDDWWEAKRASFGGDDGSLFLPAEGIRPALFDGGKLLLEVDPDEGVSVLIQRPHDKPVDGEDGLPSP